MKRVHVAAAVICDPQRRILIARRDERQHQGGLWEFPGGKVEPGEAVEQALARELDEELGIQVQSARPQIRIRHDYSDKSVLLDVWRVDRFAGTAEGREGQPIRWVEPCELDSYAFPAANRPIVSAAQLPDRLLITGAAASSDEYLRYTEQALQRGIRWVMLRAPGADDGRLAELYTLLRPQCARYGAVLALNASVELANRVGAQALHLSSARLGQLSSRSEFTGRWLSASCHDAEELARAAALEVDFVTLSPLAHTASHPDTEPLGWARFAELSDRALVPVFALGGLADSDIERAWQAGAQGVAAISSWWGSPGALR